MKDRHLVRSGHSGQRGRLARHTSAPKSSTAQLIPRLRFPLTRRSANAYSWPLVSASGGPGDPRSRPRRRVMFTSKSTSA